MSVRPPNFDPVVAASSQPQAHAGLVSNDDHFDTGKHNIGLSAPQCQTCSTGATPPPKLTNTSCCARSSLCTKLERPFEQSEKISPCHHHKHSCTHIPPKKSKHTGYNKDNDIALKRSHVKHEDHQHPHWEAASIKARLDKSFKYRISEDEEGCPCCIAGLDFDEFAAAIKEITRANGADSGLAGPADFTDPAHWGIFLGIAAPLGLVGLAAAIRNIKGAGNAFNNLNIIIEHVDKDIQDFKKAGHHEDVKKLEAFKKCLIYSKRDARFNVWVPGVTNGIASSLVLSTAVTKHPFALPAIALYATSQLGRNLYDAHRVRNHHVKIDNKDSYPVVQGKNKVNQVASSRMKFFLSNALGFATFAAGALLTFLAVPAIGIFGAGAVAMPIGLALLSAGAVSTGIMNNIWPRKFKPRNGDLGIDKRDIKSEAHALSEIAWRRRRKKILQTGYSVYKAEGNGTKKWLKFLTALPESKDFMPATWAKNIAAFRKKWFPIIPDTGSGASSNKHQLNLDIAQRLHAGYALKLLSSKRKMPTSGERTVAIKKQKDKSYNIRIFDNEGRYGDYSIKDSSLKDAIEAKFKKKPAPKDYELIDLLTAHVNYEYDPNNKSRDLQHYRLSILAELAGKKDHKIDDDLPDEKLLQQTWKLLKELELDEQIVPLWLNENFSTRSSAPKGKVSQHDQGCGGCHDGDGHSHNHEHQDDHGNSHKHETHDHHGQSHNHEHHDDHEQTDNHEHHHAHEHTCHSHNHQISDIAGMVQTDKNDAVFNIDKFIAESNNEEKRRFQSAIDYFLFFHYPKTLTYQVYGLYDFYQQLREQPKRKEMAPQFVVPNRIFA